ncbi:hypothetical protein [Roseivivax lentus]|uniref:hypothetical protein n=1 Tax=Roseivivax lentus TaxID=633194 RepID=UPI00117A146D|nr:hypothetical protein [Roseivivax lentus]
MTLPETATTLRSEALARVALVARTLCSKALAGKALTAPPTGSDLPGVVGLFAARSLLVETVAAQVITYEIGSWFFGHNTPP